MKKILSVLIAVCMVFSFAGCGEKEKNTDTNVIDIEYYVSLGQMPECGYQLGDDVETVKSDLSALVETEGSEAVYEVTEGENNVLIDNGDFCYYYKKANPEKGVSYIVNYGTAYGFDTGAVIVEVKDALADFEYTEEPLNENNAFFMFDTSNGTVIKCNFANNTVLFVFKDNALCATALYTTADW